MKRKKKWTIAASAAGLMLMLFFAPAVAQAQTNDQPEEDDENPEWVNMMNDPDVNYFEAVNEYNDWLDAQKDQEGDGNGGEEEDEGTVVQLQFVRWMHDMYPFVQADGSILPAAERNRIIRKIKH